MAAKHGLIGKITIPFHGPSLYETPEFGCPVVRGDKFTVLLCSGVLLEDFACE